MPGDIRGSLDILIGRVCAAADESDPDFIRIAVFPGVLLHLRYWPGEVRGERADDLRLQGRQIDLYYLIKVFFRMLMDLGIGGQMIRDPIREPGDIRSICGAEIYGHTLVIGEERRRRAQFGAHVGDRCFARTADGAGARTEVFDDFIGPAADRQYAGQFQDHILRRGPAAERPGEPYANQPRPLQLPGHAGHHVYRVGSAYPHCDHAEPTGVRRVGVGADHQAAGEGVILEDDLVDDPGAGFPKA